MKKLIELRNICAGYRDTQVLKDVSINIAQKDFVGIIGPNGSGKTTLLRVILGLLKPTNGSMKYFDSSETVTKHISMGYLPQHTQIDRSFPISVREVIRSGLDNSIQGLFHNNMAVENERLNTVISRFGLREIINNHISELSGGQIQRVLLARAVISKPAVVVLDEPGTYVDLRFQGEMYELLKSINEECAIVVVGHDIDPLLHNVRSVIYVNRSAKQYDATQVSAEWASQLLSCDIAHMA